jgi:hypothetical protein
MQSTCHDPSARAWLKLSPVQRVGTRMPRIRAACTDPAQLMCDEHFKQVCLIIVRRTTIERMQIFVARWA